MTEALLTLSRRAVAAPGWRRLPGMRFVRPDGGLPLRMVAEGCYAHEGETGHKIQAASGLRFDDVPDLSDDLTALGLLALVREWWGMPNLAAVRKDGAWMLWAGGLPDGLYRLRAPTEVEVLVLALEVAP